MQKVPACMSRWRPMTSSASQGNSFKLEEGRFTLDVQKKFFSLRGGEAVEQVAQKSCGCPIPARGRGVGNR